jgi:hypothetical protein
LSEGKTLRSTGEPRENLVRDENRVSNLVSTAIFYFQKMQQNFLIERPRRDWGASAEPVKGIVLRLALRSTRLDADTGLR